ncbi:MAG TPA: hydroxyethylthiazole kinase [Syntrophales bacterium]|nr:hydroxyethylthiazole kinase [Syntrophales bacterium]
MDLHPDRIAAALDEVRRRSPMVHNITNFVVMNTTANALLALGASPVMAHAPEEVEEMAGLAQALVINIGTLSGHWIHAMLLAAREAERRKIPVILDPVGAGATSYRTKTALEIMEAVPVSVIRGNASEIRALVESDAKTKGVDSLVGSDSAIASARELNRARKSVVCISGETDYIVGPAETVCIRNGHPLMPRVTGLGCTATALCGAFAAVLDDPVLAVSAAMAVMGIAGEMAAEKAAGPGTLQLYFLDALWLMTEQDIRERLKAETLQ